MSISGYDIRQQELDYIKKFIQTIENNDASTKIELRDVRQGWGQMVVGKGLLGGPVQIKDRVFGWGIGCHADSEIILFSSEPLMKLSGFVGIEGNDVTRMHKANTVATFSVLDGDKVLWQSKPLDYASDPERFDLQLNGQKELRLIANSPTPSQFAHTEWGEVVAESVPGKVVKIGVLGSLPQTDFLPMDFYCGDETMHQFITRCGLEKQKNGDTILFTSKDAGTGLVLEFSLKEYKAFPVCEWHISFENCGTVATPILREVKSLSMKYPPGPAQTKLMRGRGSYDAREAQFESKKSPYADSFLPVLNDLDHQMLKSYAGGANRPPESVVNEFDRESVVEFGSRAGRCSDPWLPFFNQKLSTGGGLVFAIGWAGQWKAKVSKYEVEAGHGYFHAKLLPGEKIILPSVYMLRYEGQDMLRGNNILRRFIREEIAPKYDGKPIVPPACNGTWGSMSEQCHLDRIKNIRNHKMPFDIYWIDAGWFGHPKTKNLEETTGEWARQVGDWDFNPDILPNGFEKISKAAHAASLKFLLWFEPERAIAGLPMPAKHPDWYLGECRPGASLLLNLGKKEALDWCVEFISDTIEKQGIDCYREDFNIDPLPYWRSSDTPDRQGITEVKAIEGLYHFWGELRRRFPKLMIDNCASGGRRIDIELLRHSIPLWASDMQCGPHDPDCSQTHNSGLSHWIPFFAFGGAGAYGNEPHKSGANTYHCRSAMATALVNGYYGLERFSLADDYPHEWLKARLQEFHTVKDCMSGDFYPLVEEIGHSKKIWSVSEFHRPDLGQAALFAFRRSESDFETACIRLKGLNPDGNYEIHDFDLKKTWMERGTILMEHGIRVELPEPHSSRLIYLKMR